jgi:hypothetical protein
VAYLHGCREKEGDELGKRFPLWHGVELETIFWRQFYRYMRSAGESNLEAELVREGLGFNQADPSTHIVLAFDTGLSYRFQANVPLLVCPRRLLA